MHDDAMSTNPSKICITMFVKYFLDCPNHASGQSWITNAHQSSDAFVIHDLEPFGLASLQI